MEATGSDGEGIRSRAKTVGLALRNTSLSYDEILWDVPYLALMISLLSSRSIYKSKEKEKNDSRGLKGLITSMGQHRGKLNKDAN